MPSRRVVQPPSPPPGADLRVSVLTMGVGAAVWERFGHNAIVVEDLRTGTRLAYNYGMFSFRQQNFLLRFLQGRMLYWMAGYPADEDIPRYIAAERSVWQQELNLTPAQRVAMRDYLKTNALPSNAYYRYDYYRDNCSTRVRDAIDHIVNGAFRSQMNGPATGSYRFHTLRLMTHNLPLYTGLMLVLGPRADAPVTKWDEMFLPFKVREYLREVRVPDSNGVLAPLVNSERTVYESTRYPVLDAPPHWMTGFLALGTVLGGAFWWGGVAGRRSTPARWALLVGGTLWSLLTGVAGLILGGLWAFTDHIIASRNENLLQATLFAVALAAVLPALLRDRPVAVALGRFLAAGVGGCAIAGVLLKLLPSSGQVNGQVLALFVPANLGLAAAVLRWSRDARPGSFRGG